MRIWLILLLSCCLKPAFSQLETSNWLLHQNNIKVQPAGISNGLAGSFNVFNPYNLSTSVSDAGGNLVFGSDGRVVIDRNYQRMPGLVNQIQASGHNFIPVQIPGSNKYYLFYTTTEDYSNANAPLTLRYLLIDMNLNSGKGDVVEADVIIRNNVSAGFTTVEDGNTGNLWLVTHLSGTASFAAYKITAAGLGTVSVISDAGTEPRADRYIIKHMKTSPNGKVFGAIIDYTDYLSMPGFVGYDRWIEVFDFNGANGEITHKIKATTGFGPPMFKYSLEFSPDNRLMYIVLNSRVDGLQPCGWGSSRVTQFNLCYTSNAEIDKYSMSIANRYNWCAPTVSWGQMQLGADKKIHLSYSGNTISGFQAPNRIGSSSELLFNEFTLPSGNSGTVVVPSFHHKVLEKAVINNIAYDGGCYPGITSFKVTNDAIASIRWNFGDPASATNTVQQLKPSHQFSAPGKYTVRADLYDASGNMVESITELVEIKDPAKRLLYDYPTDTTVCNGQGVMLRLNVVNGVFHWYSADENGNKRSQGTADSMYISSNGKYYVEMRQNDCNGCVMWDSINLQVLPRPYTTLGYDRSICYGDSVILSVYDPAADHVWSDGSSGMSLTVKTGGTYWVRSEYYQNGCPVADTIVITGKPGVNFDFGKDTILCEGQTLVLSPGIAGGYNTWQDGSAGSASFTVTTGGKYWARVALNGCLHTDTINVSYVEAADVSLGNDSLLCEGTFVTLKTKITGASYLWNNGSTGESIDVNLTGKYWVELNNGSCKAADTIDITFTERPLLNLGNDTIVCAGEQLFFDIRITGASYKWQNGFTGSSQSLSSPGKIWVEVRKGGCVVSDTISVTHKPVAVINLGRDTTVCENTPIQLDATNASISSYQWQDNALSPVYIVTRPGQYIVKGESFNGCFSADTIVINHIPLPRFSLGYDTTICDNQELRFAFAQAGVSYAWNTGVAGGNYRINQAGLYWLQAERNGCSYRDTILIATKRAPLVNLGNDTAICHTQLMILDASDIGIPSLSSYAWNNGSTSSSISVNAPGVYAVTATIDGCVNVDSIQITHLRPPVFNLGKDTSLCDGQQIVLAPIVVNAGQYLWNDGSGAPSFTIRQPGTYKLSVTNSCGNYSDEISIIRGVCQFVMPTAFTPNNDKTNDVFRLKNHAFIEKFDMKVYNRWGQIVFESTDPARGWDGKQNINLCPEGNYTWIIKFTDKLGNSAVKSGSVLLIR